LCQDTLGVAAEHYAQLSGRDRDASKERPRELIGAGRLFVRMLPARPPTGRRNKSVGKNRRLTAVCTSNRPPMSPHRATAWAGETAPSGNHEATDRAAHDTAHIRYPCHPSGGIRRQFRTAAPACPVDAQSHGDRRKKRLAITARRIVTPRPLCRLDRRRTTVPPSVQALNPASHIAYLRDGGYPHTHAVR